MSTPTDPTPVVPEPQPEFDPNALTENEQSTANEENNVPNPDPNAISQVEIPE